MAHPRTWPCKAITVLILATLACLSAPVSAADRNQESGAWNVKVEATPGRRGRSMQNAVESPHRLSSASKLLATFGLTALASSAIIFYIAFSHISQTVAFKADQVKALQLLRDQMQEEEDDFEEQEKQLQEKVEQKLSALGDLTPEESAKHDKEKLEQLEEKLVDVESHLSVVLGLEKRLKDTEEARKRKEDDFIKSSSTGQAMSFFSLYQAEVQYQAQLQEARQSLFEIKRSLDLFAIFSREPESLVQFRAKLEESQASLTKLEESQKIGLEQCLNALQ